MNARFQAQALRINSICRQQQKKCVFFWSDVFADEAIFYSDFGEEFFYKEDVPMTTPGSGTEPTTQSSDAATTLTSSADIVAAKSSVVKQIKYPSLEAVLSKNWREIPSRFFPLSPIFIKSRLLSMFR